MPRSASGRRGRGGLAFGALAALPGLWAGPGEAAIEKAGVSAAVQGDVDVTSVKDHARRDAASGEEIFLGDGISTAARSGMQLLLMDRSVFTVGERSELIVDEYVYDPSTGAGKLSASFVKGAFRFVSGLISDKTPQNVEFKLPTGTIGIRGTVVSVLIEGGQTFVILDGPGTDNDAQERRGEVRVTIAGKETVLTRPGFAVAIGPDGAVSEPFRAEAPLLNAVEGGLQAGTAARLDTEAPPPPGVSPSAQSGGTQATIAQPSGGTSGSGGKTQAPPPGSAPPPPPPPGGTLALNPEAASQAGTTGALDVVRVNVQVQGTQQLAQQSQPPEPSTIGATTPTVPFDQLALFPITTPTTVATIQELQTANFSASPILFAGHGALSYVDKILPGAAQGTFIAKLDVSNGVIGSQDSFVAAFVPTTGNLPGFAGVKFLKAGGEFTFADGIQGHALFAKTIVDHDPQGQTTFGVQATVRNTTATIPFNLDFQIAFDSTEEAGTAFLPGLVPMAAGSSWRQVLGTQLSAAGISPTQFYSLLFADLDDFAPQFIAESALFAIDRPDAVAAFNEFDTAQLGGFGYFGSLSASYSLLQGLPSQFPSVNVIAQINVDFANGTIGGGNSFIGFEAPGLDQLLGLPTVTTTQTGNVPGVHIPLLPFSTAEGGADGFAVFRTVDNSIPGNPATSQVTLFDAASPTADASLLVQGLTNGDLKVRVEDLPYVANQQAP